MDQQFQFFLQQAINEKGSQKALATEIGVSQPFISEILHGRKRLTEKVAKRIVRVTSINLLDLMPDLKQYIECNSLSTEQ